MKKLTFSDSAQVILALLVSLCLLHAWANFVWLKTDTRPPYYDMAGHTITTLRAVDLIQSTSQSPKEVLLGLLRVSWGYPPLVYLTSAPLCIMLGRTADVAAAVGTVFLMGLIFSTYGIGRHLAGRYVGLLAAFLTSMYPIIFGLSRHYILDLPLATMVAVNVLTLIWTEDFSHRCQSLLHGLTLGFGMLTKEAFVVFIAGPFLLAAGRTLLSRETHRRNNVLLTLLVAAVVGLPWYAYNYRVVLDYLDVTGRLFGIAEGDPLGLSLASLSYYPLALANDQTLLGLAILCVGAAVVLTAQHGPHRGRAMLGLWVLVPYVVFTLSRFGHKDVRFTMPLLPAVALISAMGILSVRGGVSRAMLIALIVLVATIEFVGLTFGLNAWLPSIIPPQLWVQIGGLRLRAYSETVHIASPPRAEDWQVHNILRDLLTDALVSHSSGRTVMLLVLPNCPFFEVNAFTYYALADHLPVQTTAIAGSLEPSDYEERLLRSDYVVAKTGDQGPPWTLHHVPEINAALHEPTHPLFARFRPVKQYALPDGSKATLLRRLE